MSKKTIEHAAGVLQEIKAEVNSGVINDPRISVLCNLFTGEVIGFEVVLTLSTKDDYYSTSLEEWQKRLEAEYYVISVSRNQLRITFKIMY